MHYAQIKYQQKTCTHMAYNNYIYIAIYLEYGDTTESLGELHGCRKELQVTLDTIERLVHPCGGSGQKAWVNFTAVSKNFK